ncbi:MAG: tetratricopeptide repeat protein [Pedosphaera sp.]|nr:tetratricopeptide repeat protein [Pedosphaera sp.]
MFFLPSRAAFVTFRSLKDSKKQPSDPVSTPDSTGSKLPRPRWAFRLAAAVLVPVAILCAVELGLRVAGYGYPTSFFLETKVGSDKVLVENSKFGWRFFPPGVARSPSPTVLRPAKAPGVYRIFVFGESAALGDPRPSYGMGRYLETLLRARFPKTEFEVVCVAMTAINSHAILPIARECARYDGDLWIVYMGNNEMEGPFGANTILGPRAPHNGLIRATLALRTTRIGQLMQNIGARLGKSSDAAQSWEGMKMFLKQQLPPNDSRKQIVYDNFRRNLEDIVAAGLRAGAKPVLCTVASNLRDCAPFASLSLPNLGADDRTLVESALSNARQSASTNDFEDLRKSFSEALRKDSSHAELHYHAGWSAWKLTNITEALASFERARDLDALPFRTDSRLNQITREVGQKFASVGVQLLDAETELRALSDGGIPGDDFFLDHVHFTLEGSYSIAQLLARKIEPLLPSSITNGASGNWASAHDCDRNLGITDWNRSAMIETMRQRLSDAPFTNQVNHARRSRSLIDKIVTARNGMTQDRAIESRPIYEDAIKARPQDQRLAESYAEFLEAISEPAGAIIQWQRITALMPHHHASRFQAGRLLARVGKNDEARKELNAALSIRPDLTEARLELGQLSLKESKPDQALAELALARTQRPDDARIHFQIANAQIAKKSFAEAGSSLREAIRLQPRYWEARYFLGVQLASENKYSEAQAEFEEVTRLRPNHSSTRFNLGVTYAKQGRLADAAREFEETLRIEPNHRTAQQYIESLKTMAPPKP